MLNLKPYQINLSLSILLIAIGLWSYEASGRDAHTMSVPCLGILLSFFHKPVKMNNQKIIKICMVTTCLIFIILLLPLRNSILAQHNMAVLRVSIMLAGTGFALFYYYSFFKNKLITK
ncbi:MAG: hypothetical protein ABI851_12715 [Saprospiraceae bacterium]